MIEWWKCWALGIPMVLVCLIFHAAGLAAIELINGRYNRKHKANFKLFNYLILISLVTSCILSLHIIEATAWSLLYMYVDAFDNMKASMLYSFNSFSSYGHTLMRLHDDWRLLGAIESMNGSIILGLTTAYLFHLINEMRLTRNY